MRRRQRDRGATLVEMALITPIMLMILIGGIESGVAFKDYLTVSFASREAARVGALAGNDSNADCDILASVVDSLQGTNKIEELVGFQIYQADPASGDPIPGKINTFILKPGGDPNICDLNNWNVPTYGYPPTSRKTTFSPTSELDIIGVRVAVIHSWLTGFPPFNGSFWVDEHTITRLEPEAFE